MESLGATPWDVLLVGTGLPQSLLALYVAADLSKICARMVDVSG